MASAATASAGRADTRTAARSQPASSARRATRSRPPASRASNAISASISGLAEHVGGTDHGGGQQAEGKRTTPNRSSASAAPSSRSPAPRPAAFPVSPRSAGPGRSAAATSKSPEAPPPSKVPPCPATGRAPRAAPPARCRAAAGNPPDPRPHRPRRSRAPVRHQSRGAQRAADIGQPDAHRAQGTAVGRDRRQPIAQRQRRQPREPEQLAGEHTDRQRPQRDQHDVAADEEAAGQHGQHAALASGSGKPVRRRHAGGARPGAMSGSL